MRVLISAASGLIGSAVTPALAADGHTVVRLVRRPAAVGEVRWDPAAGVLDPAAVAGFDVVVHLSGERIWGRWTAAKKAAIRSSRVDSTALLARTLAASPQAPRTLIAASAIGYYGDRGDEVLTEDSPPGTDWMARLCGEWEAAAGPATRRGIRVVHLRTGLALSRAGGALARMLLPFRL